MNYTKLFFVTCVTFSLQAMNKPKIFLDPELENQFYLGVCDAKHNFAEDSTINFENVNAKSLNYSQVKAYADHFIYTMGVYLRRENINSLLHGTKAYKVRGMNTWIFHSDRYLLEDPIDIQMKEKEKISNQVAANLKECINWYYTGKEKSFVTKPPELNNREELKKIIRFAGYIIANARLKVLDDLRNKENSQNITTQLTIPDDNNLLKSSPQTPEHQQNIIKVKKHYPFTAATKTFAGAFIFCTAYIASLIFNK